MDRGQMLMHIEQLEARLVTQWRELAEARAQISEFIAGEEEHPVYVSLEQQRDRLRADYKALLDICPTPGQLNGMADFILRHGDLDNNAQCLTQMVLRQKAEELKALAGGEGE